MSKTSSNLSDRVFVTVDHWDESMYIGELEGEQKKLVELTPEEFTALRKYLNSMKRQWNDE